MSREEFAAIWSGKIYVIKRVYKLSDETQPFSLRWFIPEILRQKITFVDIALAVLFINAISLVTPIFFQIVIDKVLVNQAYTIFGTVRTRVERFIANNEILKAKTFLEILAVDHLTGQVVMVPQSAGAESEYNEQYILWAGTIIIK